MAFKKWVVGVPGEFDKFYAYDGLLYESKAVANRVVKSLKKYDKTWFYSQLEVRPVEVKYLDEV